VQGDLRRGQPKTQRTDANVEMVRTLGVRVIAEGFYMNRETVRQIVKEDLGMILHHDDAPAQDALRVREFLAKNSITKMDHPPYSPDLAPCDFCSFQD
jgi:hypothetical protein